MRFGQLVAAIGELCADLHGRGLWDAADDELLEAAWQFQRNVGHLPPALIRSGRIELWLEMRLPDEAARALVLEQILRTLPPAFGVIEAPRLVDATAGFTGADLQRLIDDGKNLFAHDKVRGMTLRPATEYFLQAVETVRDNKARYADAEARARSQRPARPVIFDPLQILS